jgi:hypothetical protein
MAYCMTGVLLAQVVVAYCISAWNEEPDKDKKRE